jgi:hypothetical protein
LNLLVLVVGVEQVTSGLERDVGALQPLDPVLKKKELKTILFKSE